MKVARWENWTNLILGAAAFLAPWIFSFSTEAGMLYGAMWNFWIVGMVVFFSAVFALVDTKPWEEWTNLFAGAWLAASPWIFNYSHVADFRAYSLVVGLLLMIVSALAIPEVQRKASPARKMY